MPAVLSGNVMKVDSMLTAIKDRVKGHSGGNQQQGVVVCIKLSKCANKIDAHLLTLLAATSVDFMVLIVTTISIPVVYVEKVV